MVFSGRNLPAMQLKRILQDVPNDQKAGVVITTRMSLKTDLAFLHPRATMLTSSSRIARFVASVAFGATVLCASTALAKPSWVVFDADSNRILGRTTRISSAHRHRSPR